MTISKTKKTSAKLSSTIKGIVYNIGGSNEICKGIEKQL
jgi:hypothetical protein